VVQKEKQVPGCSSVLPFPLISWQEFMRTDCIFHKQSFYRLENKHLRYKTAEPRIRTRGQAAGSWLHSSAREPAWPAR
jgi:hypothetical protein